MKKFLIKVGLFLLPALLFIFLADLCLTFALKKSKHKLYVVWNDIVGGKLNADVWVIGSSRARAHIDSKVLEDSLGMNVYNLGLDGYTFDMQYCRFKLAMAKNKKPAYIIHSLDYGTFTKNPELYQPEQFTPYFNEPILTKNMRDYAGFNSWDYSLPLVRFVGQHEQILHALKISLRPSGNKGNRYKGFYSTYIPWTNEFEEARKKNPHLIQPVDTGYQRLFEQYLQEVNKLGIKLIFVFSPVYIEGQEYISNSKDLLHTFSTYSKKHHIPFFDYSNDSICFNKSFYYNTTHLQKSGADVFSRKLGHDLKEKNLFPANLSNN